MKAVEHLKGAMVRGTQWRYLLVFVAGTFLPSLLLFGPAKGFFGGLFDHAIREASLVRTLDSPALFEVLRQMGEPAGESLGPGLSAAFFATLLVAPALAGAAAAVAQSEAPLATSALMAAAARLYLRMLRMAFVALVPVGLAVGASAAILHAIGKSNAHAVHESAAWHATLAGWFGAVVLVGLASSTVEVGRAYLVAEPERRSAFLAWWRGARLTVRRPVAVLGTCLATTAASLVLAFLLTALRLRLFPGGMATILLGFLVAQAAVAVVGWGRASRLAGLVSVIRGYGTGTETGTAA
ncbi:MAG TPA: hypothetical protein VGG39_14450 [Polyangiaceae bacterium]|jgi:hypothetical protein